MTDPVANAVDSAPKPEPLPARGAKFCEAVILREIGPDGQPRGDVLAGVVTKVLDAEKGHVCVSYFRPDAPPWHGRAKLEGDTSTGFTHYYGQK